MQVQCSELLNLLLSMDRLLNQGLEKEAMAEGEQRGIFRRV